MRDGADLNVAGEVDRGVRLACLLVDDAARFDAAAVERLAQTGACAISNRSADDAGWLELLRDGLTFDLDGLAPAAMVPAPQIANWYGVPADTPGLSAITLSVGPHLAGAAHLLPVIRVAAALLAELATLPGVRAVAWLPASSATRPDWFTSAARAWIDGGPFPALVLSALERDADALRSRGLDFLIGTEFRLSGQLPGDEAARIAIRLTDWLVAHGAIDHPREVVLEGMGAVWLAPGPDGVIEVRRR